LLVVQSPAGCSSVVTQRQHEPFGLLQNGTCTGDLRLPVVSVVSLVKLNDLQCCSRMRKHAKRLRARRVSLMISGADGSSALSGESLGQAQRDAAQQWWGVDADPAGLLPDRPLTADRCPAHSLALRITTETPLTRSAIAPNTITNHTPGRCAHGAMNAINKPGTSG
jgi:hypothetical protein